MITLGINAAFHDSAAVLVIDGSTVAAAEEERFSRIKHAKRPLPFSAWELPFGAIDFCLAQAGITVDALDHIAYSFDPQHFLGARADTFVLPSKPSLTGPEGGNSRPDKPRAKHNPPAPKRARATNGTLPPPDDDSAWESPWDPLFTAHIVHAPAQFRDGVPHHLRRRLRAADPTRPPKWQWHFVNHHLCHQASAFLAAPFERCAVMTLDGRGERATAGYGVYADGGYRSLGEVSVPDSLGVLFEQATTHLGFLHSSDEYKVMALAALGRPVYAAALRAKVRVEEGGGGGRFTVGAIDFAALAGPPRGVDEALGQRHFDLAASLQLVLEETVRQLIGWLREASNERQLAMAGGVALNCVMNARLRDSGIFDAIWVQPAAGDAGTALGAALWVDARLRLGDGAGTSAGSSAPVTDTSVTAIGGAVTSGGANASAVGVAARSTQSVPLAPRRWTMEHAYLGPAYDDATIEALLRWAKLRYRRLDDVAETTAGLLAQDRIVGWFQGRMEFGPRALGARSLLASPINPEMQARLNELKDREDFRPVAPAVPQEDLAQWFAPAAANGGASPFMLFVYDVVPGQGARIPSACHTDRTARVQTVSAATNPRFHALLQAFGRLTGVPVLVNTSFNVRGQPIVCTPQDALEAFFSTPLDALVIGSFLLEKSPGEST